MAISIHCKNPNHEDLNPSAILNNDITDRFPIGTVYCFACRNWYHIDNPELTFNSYNDLSEYLKGQKLENKVKRGRKSLKQDTTSKRDIEKFPVITKSNYDGPFAGYKSRINLYGQTLKSYIKDDTSFISKNGEIIYTNKHPRVANDFVGTHETVKEYMWSEEDVVLKVSKGFYNRFAVDSDNTELPLEERLLKVCKVLSIGGFWLILNRDNDKFQANINLLHTTCGGTDMTKIRYIARCANELAGDPHMTNSIMKNHKVDDIEINGLIKGAQVTETYGFDLKLYLDYQDFVSKNNEYNFKNFWMPKINSGELNIVYIHSDRKNKSGVVIPLIEAPKNVEFSIRKDKTWAQPLETMWKATVLKYPRSKNEETSRVEYVENKSYSNMFVRKQQAFNLCTSILKDVENETQLNMLKPLMNRYINIPVDKFFDYYKPSMHKVNLSTTMLTNKTTDNRATGSIIFDKIKDIESQAILVTAIRSVQKDGNASLIQKGGLIVGWNIIVNRVSTKSKDLALALSKASDFEIELIRVIFKYIESNAHYFGLSFFDNFKYTDLPNNLKPIVSIATELVYNDALDFCTFMQINEDTISALDEIKKLDFNFYASVMIQYIVSNIIKLENIDFNIFLENKTMGNTINECNEKSKELTYKSLGFNKRISILLECQEEINKLIDNSFVYKQTETNEFPIEAEVEIDTSACIINTSKLEKEIEQIIEDKIKTDNLTFFYNQEKFRQICSTSLQVFLKGCLFLSLKKYILSTITNKNRRNKKIIANVLSNSDILSIISNIISNNYYKHNYQCSDTDLILVKHVLSSISLDIKISRSITKSLIGEESDSKENIICRTNIFKLFNTPTSSFDKEEEFDNLADMFRSFFPEGNDEISEIYSKYITDNDIQQYSESNIRKTNEDVSDFMWLPILNEKSSNKIEDDDFDFFDLMDIVLDVIYNKD